MADAPSSPYSTARSMARTVRTLAWLLVPVEVLGAAVLAEREGPGVLIVAVVFAPLMAAFVHVVMSSALAAFDRLDIATTSERHLATLTYLMRVKE